MRFIQIGSKAQVRDDDGSNSIATFQDQQVVQANQSSKELIGRHDHVVELADLELDVVVLDEHFDVLVESVKMQAQRPLVGIGWIQPLGQVRDDE